MFNANCKSVSARIALALVLLAGVFGVSPVHASTIVHYVKQSATGANDGTSWSDAYTDLQSALAAASSGDEIWVAAGTYKPTSGTDRTTSFMLKNGVAIYGGFVGTETFFAQRDQCVCTTILSGEIGIVGDNSDNSYHVVVGSNTDHSAILDRFTITAGYANGDVSTSQNKGGGMYSVNGNPTLTSLVFSGNSAVFGGGMFNDGTDSGNGSSPILTDVSFRNNSAEEGGGMENMNYSSPSLTKVTFRDNTVTGSGGGMTNFSSNPTLLDVKFRNNTAKDGGGIANFQSSPSLMNVAFTSNSAESGGGMVNTGSSPAITNVTLNGNTATTSGGGISNQSNSNPVLTNVTLSGNMAATNGGGIFNDSSSNPTLTNVTISGNTAVSNGGGFYNEGGSVNIRNSILYGNAGGEILGTANITYSIVQGGYAGMGNLDADPLLGTLQNNGGPTLTAALGNGSPAIDAGNDSICPNADQRGIPRPQDSHCDMGAFEYRHVIHRVKWDAVGSNDGTSWTDAYTDLQSALSASLYGDEIWIAAGTYYPTSGTDRTVSFDLRNGVSMYGGFSGVEMLRNERNFETNLTILSGDIGIPAHNSDNSYHVVTGGDVTATIISEDGIHDINSSTILDGLTITAGNANGELSYARGGGMINVHSDPTITNVMFTKNLAASYGGGMHSIQSSLTLTNVTFSENSAGYGGGLGVSQSTLSLTNVTVSENSATYGGGMYNSQSDPTLINVTFGGNSASTQGGGIFDSQSDLVMTNVTMVDNSAVTYGGGLYDLQSNPIIHNTILWGNSAPTGAQIYKFAGSAPIVSDSVLQGGYAGGTNIITADPMLGALGNHSGFTETIPVLPGSSAIDSANDTYCPTTDQRGVTRPQGSHCDIGAYEYDVLPPQVSSIERGSASPTSASSVSFTVTFSEAVTGVDSESPFADFALTTAGVTGASITSVSGSGATRTVTVNTGSGNGTIRLDVVDDDSIKDMANNPLGGLGLNNGNFTDGETYTIIKGFHGTSKWTSAFDLSHGWTVSDFVRTVGDVNGDAKADLVGFGLDGVYVALSTGTGFGAVSKWTGAFDLSHGWTVSHYVRTVGDVSGDGKADLVGFGLDGVYVALSNGSSFGAISKWSNAFDLSHGWTVSDYVRTVGDVNDDGKDDVVGFGQDGVYIALSNGGGFDSLSKWTSAFDKSHGWRVTDYVRTVGDVSGDGKADLVGFGLEGAYIALSNGTGFDPISKWTSSFDLSHGWTVADYVRTVGDVNGDGKEDLVGFGLDGVYIALSTGGGFTPVSRWTSAFDLSHGWTVQDYVRTVGDVNGDGKADLVGFGLDGVYIALAQ